MLQRATDGEVLDHGEAEHCHCRHDPKRQRDEERGGQADHESTGVSMRQFQHGVMKEEEKIVGEPEEDAGQGIGHRQVDEQNVVDRSVVTRDAETTNNADHKDVQGHGVLRLWSCETKNSSVLHHFNHDPSLRNYDFDHRLMTMHLGR